MIVHGASDTGFLCINWSGVHTTYTHAYTKSNGCAEWRGGSIGVAGLGNNFHSCHALLLFTREDYFTISETATSIDIVCIRSMMKT